MRVAIIGAGASGLACAHELEYYGIYPDIFEERSQPGELFSHVGGILQLMNRPARDQLKWLKKDYHLDLTPLHTWKKLTMHAPNISRVVTSRNFGYFFERGQGAQSMETQLAKSIRSTITFNHRANYSQLAQEYDYVVVATGNSEIASTLGIWQETFTTMVRGAIVLGQFDPAELIMWVNTDYALSAYAYLTAFSPNRASLILIHGHATPKEMERHWTTFFKKEKLDYQVTENYLLSHTAGTAYPHQLGNLLLIGAAGGFMESFLGFGMVSSLRSGILAARAIVQQKPFGKLANNLHREMQRSVRIREALNTMENADYDRLVAAGTLPLVKNLIYHTNFPILRYASNILDLTRASVDWEKKSILPAKKPD